MHELLCGSMPFEVSQGGHSMTSGIPEWCMLRHKGQEACKLLSAKAHVECLMLAGA